MLFLLELLLFINTMIVFLLSKKEINLASTLILFWSAQIVLTVLYLDNEFFNFYGLIYIVISLLVTIIGYYICYKSSGDVLGSSKSISEKRLNFIILVLLCIYLIYTILRIYIRGYSITDFFSIEMLFQFSHESAIDRYAGVGTGIPTVLNTIFLSAGQMIPCLSGLYLGIVNKKKIQMISIAFVPALLEMILSNVKASLIAAVIMFLVFYFIGYKIRVGKYPNFNFKLVIIAFFSIFILFFLFILSFMFRMGAFDLSNAGIIIDKMVSYAFGHIPAFDSWFFYHYNWFPEWFGTRTFLGLLQGLGLVNREMGLYTDYYNYEFISTNVYTYFRGSIIDFGILGNLLFCFILSSIAGFLERYIRRGAPFAITILAAIWIFNLYYIASIFIYVSYILSFVGIYILLAICSVKKENLECDGLND